MSFELEKLVCGCSCTLETEDPSPESHGLEQILYYVVILLFALKKYINTQTRRFYKTLTKCILLFQINIPGFLHPTRTFCQTHSLMNIYIQNSMTTATEPSTANSTETKHC